MEHVGEILKRIGTNISGEDTDTSSSGESTEVDKPGCPICKGAGFVHPLLPSGRPDFVRVVPCQCNHGESEEAHMLRLRRESGDLGLKLLSGMSFEKFEKRLNLSREEQTILDDAIKLARRFAEEPEGWLVFLGPNGCGKTHLAAAIGNYQLKRGKPVIFIVVPDFLDHLRSTYNTDGRLGPDELFDRVKNATLLILDDFGEQAITPWAQEKLYQLINYRYNDRLPTVITTCLSLENLENRIGSRLGDPRLSTPFNIDLPDYRSDLAPSERGKPLRKTR